MYTMQKFNIKLLSSYTPFNLSKFEGQLVTKDRHELFVVKNGSLQGFRDWDAFVASGLNAKAALVIDELGDAIHHYRLQHQQVHKIANTSSSS